MKGMAFLTMSFLVMGAAGRSAWAAGATQTASSSMLVLLFIGVCALIVVAQLVPALILMIGTISAFAKRIAAKKQVAAVRVNQGKTK